MTISELNKKIAEYELLIRDLTDVVRAIPRRNDVIEEVAQAIERFQPAFGPDTVQSFAVYVRGMKE